MPGHGPARKTTSVIYSRTGRTVSPRQMLATVRTTFAFLNDWTSAFSSVVTAPEPEKTKTPSAVLPCREAG